jgi:hypothetical protein
MPGEKNWPDALGVQVAVPGAHVGGSATQAPTPNRQRSAYDRLWIPVSATEPAYVHTEHSFGGVNTVVSGPMAVRSAEGGV